MIPVNKTLYEKIKKEANKKFLAVTSVYKSAWIVNEYKKLGGVFENSVKPKDGLIRWFKEKWVDINRPGKECGRDNATIKGVYPLCRPTIKVTDKTPKLLQEVKEKTLVKVKKEKQKVKNTGRVKF